MNAQKLLFSINPKFKDVPKMNKFLEKRYHITFEKADSKNRTDWFDIAKEKGYLQAMISHRQSTKGIFEWTNFDNWLKLNIE